MKTLATYPLLPSGTSDIGNVLDFGLNCLAAMNFCQAAQHCSCSFWWFQCCSYRNQYGFWNWCV